MKVKYICLPIFIICFILPIHFFRTIGLSIDNILFVIYFLVLLIMLICKKNIKFSCKDFLFILLVMFISLYQQSIVHMHLISLVVLNKLLDNKKNIEIYLKERSDFLFLICLIFVMFYSIIYFGYLNRYLYTGIKEPNESSLLILLLFLFIRANNKKLGNVLLIIGFLSFSKSYLMGVIIYFAFTALCKRLKNEKMYKFFSFYRLMAISLLILLVLSNLFLYLESNNKLSSYASSGVERFTVIMDYSNYYRFTVNTNLLYIFKEKPQYLLTGLSSNEFYFENLEVCKKYNRLYRKIRPHNYFFSYMQIYGAFSIFIFSYVSSIMKKVINNDSLPIFLMLFSFATFLGMGFNSYWLFIAVFLIIRYGGKYEKKRINYNHKNF